jgi:succinate-semialdehyde dehydrogenase/glutarate-semialdehyde dehydrogenase
VHDAFFDEVVAAAEQWRLGDPFEESTLVGPMNNEPTASKMDRHLEDALDKGAEIVRGGSRAADRPPTCTTSRRSSRASASTR